MKKEYIPIVDISHLQGANDDLKADFSISDTDESLLDMILEHPVKINSVVVGLCVSGKGRIRANLMPLELLERSVFILPPKAIFECHLEDLSPDFQVKFISFAPEFVTEFNISYLYAELQLIPYLLRLEVPEYRLMLNLYDDLWQKSNSEDHSYKREIVKYSLLAAMYQFCIIDNKYYSVVKQQGVDRNEQLIRNFYKLLLKNYRKQHHASFYAKKLFLSPKYLSAIVKEQTGKTVTDWIFELTVIEAKALLKSTKMTVFELAYYFNYADAASFGKFFKRQVGITPKEYRQGGALKTVSES